MFQSHEYSRTNQPHPCWWVIIIVIVVFLSDQAYLQRKVDVHQFFFVVRSRLLHFASQTGFTRTIFLWFLLFKLCNIYSRSNVCFLLMFVQFTIFHIGVLFAHGLIYYFRKSCKLRRSNKRTTVCRLDEIFKTSPIFTLK